MVNFFFYNKLKNIKFLNELNLDYNFNNAYCLVENYDLSNNFVCLGNQKRKLKGKIVNFNTNMWNVVNKIIKLYNSNKNDYLNSQYKIEEIFTFNTLTQQRNKAWIIHKKN